MTCMHTQRIQRLTIVFQLICSTKVLIISPMTSKLTFVRPTLVGSRFMHVSQAAHCAAIAGTFPSAHKLVL